MMAGQALLGIGVFCLLAWALSENRKGIRWEIVAWGLLLQFMLALLLLKVPGFSDVLAALAAFFNLIAEATKVGTSFVFGWLGGADTPFAVTNPNNMFIFAINPLMTVFIISALASLLWYWGWLPKALQWYKDNAFALMEAVNFATATPVWMGAHAQALDEGQTAEEAVRFADDIVSRVFPSHSPVDQAAILRDKGFWGKTTIFYGYLSTLYRAQHRLVMPLFEKEFRAAHFGDKVKTVAQVAGALIGLHTAASVLGELFMGRGPEDGDDDKDDPENKLKRWRNWYLRKLVAGPLATQPFLPVSGAFEAMMTKKVNPSPRGSPIQSLATMLGKQVFTVLNGEKGATERAGAALRVVMIRFGIPLAPFNKQGAWLVDVALDEEPVNGPLDVVSGAAYGKRKEDNPFKWGE
jgi:hypothetical protein